MDHEAIHSPDRKLLGLLLPGTVALPSCLPAVGRISVGKVEGRPTVTIEQEFGLLRTITRTVLLAQVALAFYPSDPSEPDLREGTWWFNGQGEDLPTNSPGIVFVRRDASVLTSGEFATTAEESAEFSLFGMIGKGCDPHPHSTHYKYEQVMSGDKD